MIMEFISPKCDSTHFPDNLTEGEMQETETPLHCIRF